MYYYPQNNFYPQMNNYQQQQSILKGRPVSSLEEARAAQIDFDGSLFVFPDVANKRIYTKQVNLDGTASLNVYELTQLPQTTQVNDKNFITREEFQTTLDELKKSLVQERKPTPPLNF